MSGHRPRRSGCPAADSPAPAIWAGTGLGTSLLPADLAARRLESKPIPEAPSGYGLGLEEYGNGWISHNGQLIGRESVWLYNTETGAAPDGVMPMTVARYVAGFNATELAGQRRRGLPAIGQSDAPGRHDRAGDRERQQ